MGRTRFSGPVKSTGGFEVGAVGTNTSIINSAGTVRQILTVRIPDISEPSSSWVVIPWAGTISKIYTVIRNAITVADTNLTFEIGGVAVTGAAIVIATAGSAAGTVDSSAPTALNTVTAGQALEIVCDGGSTTACEAVVSIVVEPA